MTGRIKNSIMRGVENLFEQLQFCGSYRGNPFSPKNMLFQLFSRKITIFSHFMILPRKSPFSDIFSRFPEKSPFSAIL